MGRVGGGAVVSGGLVGMVGCDPSQARSLGRVALRTDLKRVEMVVVVRWVEWARSRL